MKIEVRRKANRFEQAFSLPSQFILNKLPTFSPIKEGDTYKFKSKSFWKDLVLFNVVNITAVLVICAAFGYLVIEVSKSTDGSFDQILDTIIIGLVAAAMGSLFNIPNSLFMKPKYISVMKNEFRIFNSLNLSSGVLKNIEVVKIEVDEESKIKDCIIDYSFFSKGLSFIFCCQNHEEMTLMEDYIDELRSNNAKVQINYY